MEGDKKKYRVWKGGWDEHQAVYDTFYADPKNNDEEAVKKFAFFVKLPSNAWTTMRLERIDVEEKVTLITQTKQSSADNCLDLVG